MEEEDIRAAVELYIYDLTKGMAAMMSQILIAVVNLQFLFAGRQLDGIWHTAIVAYGREYFFGPAGIQSVRPGGTELRDPQRVEKLGETYLPYSVFLEYINGLGTSTFAPGTYNLFKHNCNSFTEEVSNFLVGKGIPKYILDLPEEILQTPIGQALIPLIETLSSSSSAGFTVGQRFVEPRIQRETSPEYQLLNTAIEEARLNSIALEERRNVINEKLAKKDRKKKKKKKEKKDKSSKEATSSDSNSTGPSNCRADMAENESAVGETLQAANGENAPAEMLPSERVMQMEEDEKREQEEKKRHRDPPIVFKDLVDVQTEYEDLVSALKEKLNDEEQTCLGELRQYVLEDEGSWALGDNFLNFVGRVLYDKTLDSDVRVKLLNVLSVAALKDDVILLLHQDRREHIIMTYAFDIDRHPPEEQLPLAQFLANMFENLSSSEWLLYISEWQHQDQNVSSNISNIRVTTKVAVHSLLSNSEDLQIRGAAIIHNLACKEVFDDVAVELTMALLQYFNGSPAEEQLYTCMKSLARFTQISGQEVPQLIQMIGPEPNKFRGTSQRIDEQIEQVNQKLR
ncbi:PPPDE peptidase domain-containing protein 2 [Trachymyrmex septentrionalis]|uniref:PPPDE peptidase domain-containing protein 2 n=1 Tax=Trachymyrmex septentrionalis TaxID=34720 RepID=A0A195F558_9HYME|nr:PPPDE peptidase domain-containing protein 2 [Trachymyrmex septentrionalis]